MSDKREFELKGLEVQCLKSGYFKALCRYAGRFGVQCMVSMLGEWDQYTLFDYREFGFKRHAWEYEYVKKRRQAVKDAAGIAHRQGMKFYLWRHELQMHPEHIRQLNPAMLNFTYEKMSEGVVDVDLGFFDPVKDELWKFISWKFDRLFSLFPELDGIVFTCLTETKIPLWNLSRRMDKTEIMARLLKIAVSKCEEHEKTLIVRNWGAYRDPRNPQGHVLLDALDRINASPDVYIMEKSVEPDFPVGYPPNKGIRESAERRGTIVELSLPQETMGVGTVPVPVPVEIQTIIQYARDSGCKGLIARADWSPDTLQWSHSFRTLETVNEINLFSCLKLMNEPEADLDRIWHEWAIERFGGSVAPEIAGLVKPAFDYAFKMYNCMGNRLSGSYGTPGPVPTDETIMLMNKLHRYHYTHLPEDKRWIERFNNPDEHDLEMIIKEKEEAIKGYGDCFNKIKTLKSKLPRRWYARFYNGFLHATEVARLYGTFIEAFFRYVRYKNSADENEKKKAKALIRKMRKLLEKGAFPNRDMGRVILARLDFVEITKQNLERFEELIEKRI